MRKLSDFESLNRKGDFRFRVSKYFFFSMEVFVLKIKVQGFLNKGEHSTQKLLYLAAILSDIFPVGEQFVIQAVLKCSVGSRDTYIHKFLTRTYIGPTMKKYQWFGHVRKNISYFGQIG